MTTMQPYPSTNANEQQIQQWSYTSGISDTPLLGQTIGDRFDQTVAR